jgi:phosphoenolpyruvate carboxylase
LSMFLDCVEYMGDFEGKISVFLESTVQYLT